MAIYDLSPTPTPTAPITNINVTEDTRGNLTSVTGSPFQVTTAAGVILPANTGTSPARATAAIFNVGPATVFLKEGTTPTVTATNYNYPLPANRLWEPDPNYRFQGAVQAITVSGIATVHVSESLILI